MKPDLRGIGMTSQRTRDRLVQRLIDKGVRDPRVLETIRQTPRHLFVDEALASRAYEDTALPIGHGQTISQPYVVARMTEALLGEEPPGRVLEVGTGCAYQSVVLSQLIEEVYSIERIAGLLTGARRRLRELGVKNVHVSHGDGTGGWEQHAPYDAILVTAAPSALPEGLLAQLIDGGRMVIPVGPEGAQMLELVIRTGETFQRHSLEPVSFVPLLGGEN